VGRRARHQACTLQIREGQPARILGAFVADWNAFIEPVRDADSACWTATNSVASSNHLSGTACDVCWNSHPFKIANAGFNAAQLKTMREMLAFYEDMVFWGNDWQSPKDAMHVQMGYQTAGPANFQKVNDFIARKIQRRRVLHVPPRRQSCTSTSSACEQRGRRTCACNRYHAGEGDCGSAARVLRARQGQLHHPATYRSGSRAVGS
jgi:hypothetical protein